MNTHQPDAKAIPKQQRQRLRALLGKQDERIRQLSALTSHILGKDPAHVRRVTLTYDFGAWDPIAHTRVPDPEGGIVFCTIYDDGTCGCIQDPPGISFPCP